jgi:hypothetical protein
MKTYSITREKAAETLGVSTRTIDRYVKSGKLSYKKIANKVLLAKEEILEIQNDFNALRQEDNSTPERISSGSTELSTGQGSGDFSAIDEKLDKFYLMIKEKDQMLEDKNKVIFMLQQRIGELETKIQHMVALPDYNKEKQATILEKERLEQKLQSINKQVKTEKIKGLVAITISIIFIVVLALILTQQQ